MVGRMYALCVIRCLEAKKSARAQNKSITKTQRGLSMWLSMCVLKCVWQNVLHSTGGMR